MLAGSRVLVRLGILWLHSRLWCGVYSTYSKLFHVWFHFSPFLVLGSFSLLTETLFSLFRFVASESCVVPPHPRYCMSQSFSSFVFPSLFPVLIMRFLSHSPCLLDPYPDFIISFLFRCPIPPPLWLSHSPTFQIFVFFSICIRSISSS